MVTETAVGGRGSDAFRGPHRPSSHHRLSGGGRARPLHPGAGAVWANTPSLDRQWQAAAHPPSAVAGPAPDSDHTRPAGLLEGIVGRSQSRDEGSLSAPPLAGGPRLRRANGARQAARELAGERSDDPASATVPHQALMLVWEPSDRRRRNRLRA